MKELIGIIAAALAFVAYIPYIRDILKGKTRPHVYSWFIWGFAAVLIFALQITHGAGAGAYTTATVAIMCFIVCLLGLRNGTKYITKLDTLFLVLALIAAGVWLFAKRPTLSMALLVSIDMLGFAPSVRKGWSKPYEETLSLWSMNGARHALSILALQQYTLLTLLNPVVWSICNLSFCGLLIVRRRAMGGKPVTTRKQA